MENQMNVKLWLTEIAKIRIFANGTIHKDPASIPLIGNQPRTEPKHVIKWHMETPKPHHPAKMAGSLKVRKSGLEHIMDIQRTIAVHVEKERSQA